MMAAPCGVHVQGVRSGVLSDAHTGVHSSALACGLTCAPASARSDIHSGVRSGIRPDHTCRKGLTDAQINILALLLEIGLTVTPYKRLALELERHYAMRRSPEAVRRTVERLAGRGFLRRKKAKEGTAQGVIFQLVHELLCPHILPPRQGVHPDTRSGIRSDVRSDLFSAPSILEKKDREILSISSLGDKERLEALAEEDIAFHWPELARAGFGTAQIRQIIQRREQVGEDVRHVMQGLAFAEWELARQCMKDAKGKAVEAPVNWVFRILASQGYYPRPPGYISPDEQAERDREETIKREQEAREARFSAEAEAWAATLSADEREAILGPKGGASAIMPEAVRLRMYFKAEVWPKLLKTGKETP